MAGFFSLGSGSASASGRETTTPQQDQTNTNNNDNNNPNWAANPSHPGLLLYRNEEIYQKGFEIWQQYVQVHHHHHHPKLFHQDHHQPFLHHALYLGGGDQLAGPSSGGGARSSSSGSRVMMRGGGSGGGGAGGINCQDCGNQAKKDCSHMRCRTCCKSRGFDCATHVKSTWVPAAKRRERQQQQILSLQQQQQSQQMQELEIGMREKRQRESRSLANADADNPLASRLGASSSGLEVGQHFPPEVSSPALFRCVRVHSVDNADEQLAYQTAVNIGGHLFKGILYDQGPDAHYPPAAGDSSSGGEPSGAATLHHHNLLTSAPANNPENAGGSGAATCVDPNAIYPPPISAFLAGTQFFPPPRS